MIVSVPTFQASTGATPSEPCTNLPLMNPP
jgi:hypothetical protein